MPPKFHIFKGLIMTLKELSGLFVTVLGRGGDNYTASYLINYTDKNQAIVAMLTSPEGSEVNNLGNRAFVERIYTNVMGPDAANSALTNLWATLMDMGLTNKVQFVSSTYDLMEQFNTLAELNPVMALLPTVQAYNSRTKISLQTIQANGFLDTSDLTAAVQAATDLASSALVLTDLPNARISGNLNPQILQTAQNNVLKEAQADNSGYSAHMLNLVNDAASNAGIAPVSVNNTAQTQETTSGDSTNTSTDSTNTSGDSTNTSTDSTNTSGDSTNTSTDSTNTSGDSTNTSTDSTNTSGSGTDASGSGTNTSGDSTNTTTNIQAAANANEALSNTLLTAVDTLSKISAATNVTDNTPQNTNSTQPTATAAQNKAITQIQNTLATAIQQVQDKTNELAQNAIDKLLENLDSTAKKASDDPLGLLGITQTTDQPTTAEATA